MCPPQRALMKEGEGRLFNTALHVPSLLHKSWVSSVYLVSGNPCTVIKAYSKSRLQSRHWHMCWREVHVLRALNGASVPGVVELLSTAHDCDHIYLIFKPCLGGNLTQRLAAFGKLEEHYLCSKVVAPLLEVLVQLHTRGVVHRDVKPDNIFFDADGGLVLGDFGLAIEQALETPISRVGTLEYMAPEVLARPSRDELVGRGPAAAAALLTPYCEKVDVWAVGVLVHEALTAALPLVHPQFGATGLKLQCCTAEAADFVRSALTCDAAARPGIAALQQHPWLQQHCCSAHATPAPVLPASSVASAPLPQPLQQAEPLAPAMPLRTAPPAAAHRLLSPLQLPDCCVHVSAPLSLQPPTPHRPSLLHQHSPVGYAGFPHLPQPFGTQCSIPHLACHHSAWRGMSTLGLSPGSLSPGGPSPGGLSPGGASSRGLSPGGASPPRGLSPLPPAAISAACSCTSEVPSSVSVKPQDAQACSMDPGHSHPVAAWSGPHLLSAPLLARQAAHAVGSGAGRCMAAGLEPVQAQGQLPSQPLSCCPCCLEPQTPAQVPPQVPVAEQLPAGAPAERQAPGMELQEHEIMHKGQHEPGAVPEGPHGQQEQQEHQQQPPPPGRQEAQPPQQLQQTPQQHTEVLGRAGSSMPVKVEKQPGCSWVLLAMLRHMSKHTTHPGASSQGVQECVHTA